MVDVQFFYLVIVMSHHFIFLPICNKDNLYSIFSATEDSDQSGFCKIDYMINEVIWQQDMHKWQQICKLNILAKTTVDSSNENII